MKTHIDQRFPEAGFVMVDVGTDSERRMVYAPLHTITKRSTPLLDEPIVLSESNWGTLTKEQRTACQRALQDKYLGRKVILARE